MLRSYPSGQIKTAENDGAKSARISKRALGVRKKIKDSGMR